MNIALILSGGTGSRMGFAIPKQYLMVRGRPVLFYSLETIISNEKIDAVQVVAEAFWQEKIAEQIGHMDFSGARQQKAGEWKSLERINRRPETNLQRIRQKFRGFSAPGKNRQLSILNGLQDICGYAPKEAVVLIHDAARPLLSNRQIEECLEAVKGHDGVLPVLPMKDTVYYSEDKKTVSLLDRERIFAGQAPEAFLLGPYLEANEKLLPERILGINGSSEPAVLDGLDVVMIPGDEGNFKITTRTDLEQFGRILEEREGWENGR